MQTIWHDENGRVKAVYDGDTTSTVWQERGYSKAVNDPGKNGGLSQRHTVTVEDGEVVSAELQPEPEPTAEQWLKRIQSRADTELQRGVSVTVNGATYGIRTGPQALALIDGAAIRADVAARNNESVSRRVPTDQGIVQFDGPALWSIFEVVENHQQAIAQRAEELQAMVADGSITESDLGEGWTS